MIKIELRDLGYDDWFRQKRSESENPETTLARVIAVNKENYLLRNKDREILAEISGKFLYQAESYLDFPTVGDWVTVQYFNDESFAVIQDILPRKSLLKRKTAGKRIEYQLIAANIDTAFIVQSCEFDFNLRRLERYLTIINESDIRPVIVLSKLDLISAERLQQEIAEIKKSDPRHHVIAISNTTGEGLNELKGLIRKGATYCLTGSSGVGKTTLLNRLIGRDVFETGAVRVKDGRGKHITARRQLIVLENGGLFIDTPGMRELAVIGVDSGLQATFADILSLTEGCRFKDCTHTHEPDCAVLKAVANGELDDKRYQNYLKLRKESEYYQMSYLEKRKKDKAFGKMVKEVKKFKDR